MYEPLQGLNHQVCQQQKQSKLSFNFPGKYNIQSFKNEARKERKKSVLKKFPVGPSERASKLMVILLIYYGNMSLIKGSASYLLP